MKEINDRVDILEGNINKEVLEVLLKDHTTSTENVQHNIIWATKNYEVLGPGYYEQDEINYDLICNNNIIMPRVLKTKMLQTSRIKAMAEVFTPPWICNAQNNLIDDTWFGRSNVFNQELDDINADWKWEPNVEKVTFPSGKTWKDYVRENRLEITCGEGPYLVSRYDATTGAAVPIEYRIGLLDRKLRVVSENTENTKDWLAGAQDAFKSTYGYEWQGDNLLLAREALLYTFQDYYMHKFKKYPAVASLKYIAYIISWNLWQMDGLKFVVPYSCKDMIQYDMFNNANTVPCRSCNDGSLLHHNGTYCIIKDWRAKDPVTKKMGRKLRFVDCIK